VVDGCFGFEAWDSRFDARDIGNNAVGKFLFAVKPLHFAGDPENAVFIFVKSVERNIIAGNEVNDQACADANGQAEDIDGGVHFLSLHNTPGE